MLPLGEPLATDAMTQKQDKKLSPLRRVPLSVGAWGNSTAPAVKIRSYSVRTFASRPAIYVMSCLCLRRAAEIGPEIAEKSAMTRHQHLSRCSPLSAAAPKTVQVALRT